MKVIGIAEVELISVLRKKLEKVRDDIEWADPDDPRIEGLVNEINYYKQKEEEDESETESEDTRSERTVLRDERKRGNADSKGFGEQQQQQRERRVLDEVAMDPHGAGQRLVAAVSKADPLAHAEPGNGRGQGDQEEAECGRIERGDRGERSDRGRDRHLRRRQRRRDQCRDRCKRVRRVAGRCHAGDCRGSGWYV